MPLLRNLLTYASAASSKATPTCPTIKSVPQLKLWRVNLRRRLDTGHHTVAGRFVNFIELAGCLKQYLKVQGYSLHRSAAGVLLCQLVIQFLQPLELFL